MAKKKYTPEATVDLLYNQLMSDYKGDAQVEAERQRQKSAEKKASGNSTNSSTSAQNTLQSPSAVSRGASAVGNIYKAPERKYTTGKTTHGYTTARSFAKDQTTKPKTSGTRGIGSATQEAFERGLSSRSLKENVGQRSSLSNKKSYTKESDLSDISRNRSHNQAKILDKMQAFAQTQRYENELKKQRAEYDRLREEHPTSEWLKEEGWGALTNFNSTLASTADWLLPDVITPKAVQNALDYYKKEDEKQQKIVEEVRGGDPLRTIGGNLGVNIVQNVPAMLLAPLTAEGAIATTAGTLLNPETLSQTGNAITRALYSVARETGNNPMFWETFLRTAGPTYDKEIESGADPVRATLSALTNGLLNAQIEIGGGIEKFDPTETFWKALRRSGEEEGLEEIQQYAVEGLANKALGSNTAKWFSTKRGEDAVINPIDMAEQGAYGALAGGLMGGGRAGVATLSRSLADAEYNRAFPDSKAHTQDLVEQALMQAREGQKSSEAEILATNIQNMMEQGEEVPTVLVRQLHNEVLRAQAENERDFSERKNEGYQQAVSEGRANTVETQDTEEESRVFRSVADEKAQTYYDTAMDKMGENASEKSARAISKLMVGVHTNQDIDTILIDKNARNAVEEMTGIDLPIKNTEAREILETRGLTNMVANRDNMLQETHNVIRSNMRSREGAVFEKNYDNAVKTIGVANAPEIYESVFSRFKNAGMVRGSDFDSAYDRIVSPLTKDFGEDLGGRIALVFNRDFAHQAFDAGRQAYIADEAKTSAREKAVSAERAGTVTYKHDTESRLSTRQKKFMTEFAKRAKLGIEFYDGTQEGEDDSANGYYENGVIHININSTNKLITVAKHELTHHIKVTAPEMYRKLEDFVIKKWYNNDPDAFDERVLEYQRKWNCSVEVAYEEIIANASEAFFTDRGTIDDAIKFSKKLGHTIHDGIRTLLDTFLDIRDTDRLGDRGYGEFLKELNILKDAQRMWLEALDQSVNRARGRNASETKEQQLDNFLKEHNLERIDEPKRSLKVREDNRGGTISDSQFEFFKNSQAVDDDGRLVLLWHTTKKGGFSIFNREKSDDKRSFFFSDSFAVSQTYARNANKPIEFDETDLSADSQRGYYEVYLNLLNPLIVDAHDSDWKSIPYGEKERTIWDDASFKVKRFETNWVHNDYKNPRRLNGVYVTMVAEEKDLSTGKWHNITFIDELNTDETDEEKAKNDLEKKVIRWWEERGLNEAGYWEMLNRPEPFDGEWNLDFEDNPVYFDIDGYMLDESNYSAERYDTRDLAEIAENAGYDGVIIRNVYDFDDYRLLPWGYDGKSNVYIAFQPDQIKLASNETPTEDKDIRRSKKDDQAYLDAVNRGDMKTAQRMVEQEARKHGYNSPMLYHGTNFFGFTQVNSHVNGGQGSFWATDNDKMSATYVHNPDAGVRDIGDSDANKRYNEIERDLDNSVNELANHLEQELGKPLFEESWSNKILDEIHGDHTTAEYNVRSFVEKMYTGYGHSEMASDAVERFRGIFRRIGDLAIDLDEAYEDIGGIYRLYANTDNLYVVEGNGNNWNNLSEPDKNIVNRRWEMYTDDNRNMVVEYTDEGGEPVRISDEDAERMLPWDAYDHMSTGWFSEDYGYTETKWDVDNDQYYEPRTTRTIEKWAKENGYDGVLYKDIYDNGKYGVEERGDVYAFFNPDAQVKSADPVTYDDNGDVIPLSERFNDKNEDIRYSKKDAILDRIIDERRQKANDGEQLSFFGSLNDTMPEAPKQKTPAELFYDDVLSTIAEIKKKGGWTGQEITHLLDETIYGGWEYSHDSDFHFIERLNDRDDDTAMSDFNAFLSFFVNETDLRNYKWYFSQYRSDKYWKTAFRSGKTKFTKAIDKRIEEIMAGKAKGRNVGIEARNYTLNEAREIFNSLNTDKDLQELADKVFDCIDKNFRVVYRGDTNIKGFSHTKGGIRGTSAGRTIDLNMKLFNSEAYTDQEKAHTLLHESIHAVTVYAINVYHNAEQYGMDVYDLPYNVRLACDQLDKVYDAIKYDSSFKGEYGVTNVKEMVAELSNPAFRAKLKAKNLYQRIVDAIKKIFGIDTKNAYDAVNVSLEVLLNNADAVTFEKYAHYTTSNSGARYSKKDSDGNTITDAQAEYFKDSKARDKDGNLLVVYHGTSTDFTIFDRGQIGRHGSYEGAGFNFTPSETRAGGYKNVGNEDSQGRVLAGYVNITHPLSSSSTTFTARQLAEVIRQIDPTGDDIIANYARDTNDYGKPSFIARESLYTARQLLNYHDTDVDIYSDLSASGGNADSLINAFKDMGYDGVIHYDDDGKIKTLITFDSNQFKNIDNENPTDNPDIRLSPKTENEALPKARTIPKKIKDRLIALGADKLGKGGLKAPIQISVRDLRTLWYNLKGSEEGERLNTVLESIGDELQELAGKYRYVSLADALEGTIHYRVDENGKPTSIVLSCKVKNAEYDINFDFTTICAKRAPLQKVLERFIKTEGKNKGETLYDELKLDEEGLYTLRSIMEQEGFDVSCIGCFVEQNRYAQQTQSKTVADDWNKALDEWAKEHGVEITEGFDFQNLDIDQLPYFEIQRGFRQYSALMKGKPTTVENKNKALIEAIPYLRKRLGNSDYASIAGQRAMMAMGNGKTNLYNLLKRGQGDSKQSTPFVPYNGEVALLPETKKGKKIFDYLFGIGGARAQSASDFQIEYVFDYMQLVGDLSARGLPMHMYTKVIECAELLGMCGIKINLSAMCDVDSSVDGEYAGLKKVNDEWVYNISKQSIDYERAVKLQRKKGYRKNIGIIMVVLSKQHMLKALSDADVRYIIGYHSSKMPPIVARASKMEGATDYTKLNKTNRLNDKGRALFAEAMSQAKGKTELEKYKDALRIFDDLIQADKLKTRGEVPRRGNEYTRYMSSFKANTADFDVYDDIKKTNDPRATADNYIRYCMENDLVPMYFPFAFHENYYKCEVYDYNVYDNVDENGKPTGNGKYAPMEAVQNIYPELNIANGETDTKRFMAKVRKMIKRQNKKNAKVEPKYEAVERRAIAELSITGNDYMDMDASGIDHAELEHRVDMTEEAVEERRRSIKEKELNAKTIEYQSTIRKLEKNVEGLKAQFKRTNKKPNPVEARRQAGRLIQRHASNMRIHEDVANTLTEIYEMYAKRGAKAFDDIYAIAERTAVEIVNNISEVHFEGQEEYKQIKDYLRDTDIVVSEEMKRNITDFNDFRKSHFGKLKLVNGERSNIDSVYEELSEMFPSQFTDEYVNPADQLNHIADVLDSYAPFYETLDGTSEEMQDYVVAIASDLMETAYNLQKSKTFADKKYDEKVEAVKKAREKALANKKEALSKLRARYSSRMAEAVRDAKSETKAKIDEKAQKKRRIAQIAKTHKRLADKLFTPSDTKHLPDGYDKAVANVLHMFDFTTSRMEKWAETHDEPSKRMQALRDLRKRLESYVRASEDGNKEGVDLGMEVDSDLVGIVDELEGALGENVKLSDLDSTVLEDVATLFRAFEHQINSYNRAFDENNQKRISDLADVVVDEAKAVKHGKWRAGIMGRVFTSNLNPWDFFQMIGGEVGSLYEATRKGFDKYENNLRVAKNFMADLIGSKQYDKWANHTKTYKTTSGEEITLTDTQLMSLYCLSKREQAQEHIYGQGVVSAPVKVKRNMIVKQLYKKRVIPTFDDVVDWTKNLSKEQIEVADKIQNFLSNEVAEWGNETSLKLYGYKKFTEKDYFPIQSSDDYLNSNFDAKGSDPTLKNISPTKAVVKGANNPLMLDDIFSIFSKHVAQMASYNGFVPAITDFQRVWNHKMVSADGRKTTVKETFGEAYGDRIAKYVEQFYADLNGVYKKNLDVTTPEKLFGTFKKSAVGGNLRVLAQQPMAIARAMLLIDPALLTVSVPKTALQAKRTYQEMLEHCPIAEWKVWGFYSPDVMGASRDLKNVMLGKDSISDKVFMNMYGVADNITWTVIFNACKMQVERQNKGIAKGSQEYWDKVNDLASDVYDATQVVDSPFHRSELMKSQDGIHKMATAFMAEPTKTVNMINTQLTLCAREISEGKVGKATLRFTRLTGTVLANAMLLAVGQSLIDAMRSAGGGDDDDDKGDFEERFQKHWVTNTKDNLNLLKMLPYVKDAVSIYEGFGVTRMDMNGVEKAVKATQNLKKYYDDPGSTKYTELELWNNTAMAFAYTLGVPISNAKRDLDSLALTVAESVKDPKVMLWYMKNKYQVNSKTKSIWADAYYDALDKGNKTLANNIYAYMKKSGVGDKYIQNRKTTWEKHRYGEEEEE